MAEGGFDDFEMGERGEDVEKEQEGEEETKFNNGDDNDDGLIYITNNSNTDDVDNRVVIDGDIPNISNDKRSISNSITLDRKLFLEKAFSFKVRVADGENSKTLINDSKIVFGVRGKPNSIEFNGKKVVVSRDGGKTFVYSRNVAIDKTTGRYKELVENAREEHMTTTRGVVENAFSNVNVNPSDETVDSVVSETRSNISDRIEELQDVINTSEGRLELSEQDIRELRSVENPIGTSDVKVRSLDLQANYFEGKARDETDPLKKEFYEHIVRIKG